MTQLASVTTQTIEKCRQSLEQLNNLTSTIGMVHTVHEALDGGYDVVVGGRYIAYHTKHIKQVIGYLDGVLDGHAFLVATLQAQDDAVPWAQ